MDKRKEIDSMGEVYIEKENFWGPVSQRSLDNFPKGLALMPIQQIESLILIKKAAAIVNYEQDKLDFNKKEAIVRACDKILGGGYYRHFPLTVYQTGSGTQTNMNVNEVIAYFANEILESPLVHPNDHVNMSQSTNDTFPTAMHMTSIKMINEELLPEIESLAEGFYEKAEDFVGIIKTGRTHLQDATPLSLSDEIKTYGDLIKKDGIYIKDSLQYLKKLAIGGTAVGSSLNTKKGYDILMAKTLSDFIGYDLQASTNKFLELSSKTSMTKVHGAIKILATDLMKIAEDIRFLSSGPRTGIGEIIIPSNEPGSSIMPGKVNPTQIEMLMMICLEIIGNDLTISMANSLGQLELNTYMPLIIYKMVDSVKILSKGLNSFNKNLLKGLMINEDRIKENLDKSLMLVTSLSPIIGYEKSAKLAKLAYKEGISLREANKKLSFISDDEFLKIVDPKKMI